MAALDVLEGLAAALEEEAHLLARAVTREQRLVFGRALDQDASRLHYWVTGVRC